LPLFTDLATLTCTVAFNDIMELQFQSRNGGGQAYRNTFHFRRNPTAGSIDATFLQALAADSNTDALADAYEGLLTTTDRLDGILLRATRDPTDPGAERDEAFLVRDAIGTRAVGSTQTPVELGCLLKLSTDLAGRRYRGRSWLPPILDTAQVIAENRSTTGTYHTKIAALITQLLKTTYPSGAGHYGGSWNDLDMVVFSRKARIEEDTYYARVTSIVSPAKIRWLRSRNPTGQ
jgi:hypothetical protein